MSIEEIKNMPFIKNLLSKKGDLSIKSLIGILGFMTLAIPMIISIFFRYTIPLPIPLIDAVTYITITALFGNVAEKFSRHNKDNKVETNTTDIEIK